MLEKIKRDPSILIERYKFTVQKRIDRQPFASARYLGKLFCKKIPPPRPESDTLFVSAGETAVAIEFYFVKPSGPLGSF